MMQLIYDVIVDDIKYYDEPMFQDGIIAQAVDQVVVQGIPYFLAAVNYGRTSWDARNGFIPVNVGDRVLHRFGTTSSGAPITRMRITMEGDYTERILSFQWDESFKSHSGVGSQNDLDIFFYYNGELLVQSIDDNIANGDPYEQLQITAYGGLPVTLNLKYKIMLDLTRST